MVHCLIKCDYMRKLSKTIDTAIVEIVMITDIHQVSH